MSTPPPSSGRPTGPPSGPLSGPSQPGPTQQVPTPPPGPPAEPPSGGGSGGSGGPRGASKGPGEEPGRPWWRSAPRVAAIAGALVAAVVLTVVLTRPDGGPVAGGEVLLQAAGSSGPDPYTGSTARKSSPTTSPPSASASTPQSESTSQATVTRGVRGSAPGLYGGTRNTATCDVEKQITALTAEPAKSKAFASVLSIEPSGVPAYLRKLTPVQLRMDTRVTNHGYRGGSPTSYQAVLQAGTAVLVDNRGVPRVRCACGNPLLPPVAVQGTPRRTGDNWPAYQPSKVVAVAPAVQVVNVFIMFDPRNEEWFSRDAGDTGGGDKKTPPPVTDPSPPTSPCPSPPVSGSRSPDAGGSADTCPPSSASPFSPPPFSPPPSSPPPSSPSAPPPSSEPPTSQPPPESPAEDSPAPPSPQSGSAAPGGGS
ncbi:DUF6777 domain-containing protein [Streptomyces sp. H27-C3]|uniref:DUF6777 domain-containing protein n=1 Tax=Streptomyces sp. H27-C3 TaxID=3046305 RepID=UPI0024BACFA1|nr:DUF6777 domain-containing protein [Streptomyces sp. H27-C3]MDJ0465535.1 hypothetical protein [Streptomyces sp. H27-C3]